MHHPQNVITSLLFVSRGFGSMRRPKVIRPIGPIGPTIGCIGHMIGCIARIQGHSYRVNGRDYAWGDRGPKGGCRSTSESSSGEDGE